VTLDKPTTNQGRMYLYHRVLEESSGALPVGSLTLGNVSYTQAQLLQILNQPVAGMA